MTLPETYSAAEVCQAFGISPAVLAGLVKDGKVGYFLGKRAKRFTAENVNEIRVALEVKPKAAADDLSVIGVTRRSAARRRAS